MLEDIKILNRIAEIERTRYKKSGDYSVTDLITPPRLVHLFKRHKSKIVQPLSQVVAAMIGTAVHEYFEKNIRAWMKKHSDSNYTLEKEVKYNLSVGNETRLLSGRYDIKEGNEINDIKTCKTWKKIFDPEMENWTWQLNMYSYLSYLLGDHIDKLTVTAVYLDWIQSKSLRDSSYPEDKVIEYDIPIYTKDIVAEYIYDRLGTLIECESLKDYELPVCSRKDRWERFQGGHRVEYAIFKNRKAARAKRVIKTSLDDAFKWAESAKGLTKDSFIEVRYAQRKRCEDWCSVKDYCNVYHEYKQKKKSGSINDFVPLKV